MTEADVDSVLAIEQSVHAHPWTRGNFCDALKAGYICQVLEGSGQLQGYAVLMKGVDEAELLTIGIAAGQQRKGLGRMLLQAMLARARAQLLGRVFLEVRPSNLAAIALYRSAGFRDIGLRRGYYPSDNGREDALLMECQL